MCQPAASSSTARSILTPACAAAGSLPPHHPARRAPSLPAYLRQQRRLEDSVFAQSAGHSWRTQALGVLPPSAVVAPDSVQAASAVSSCEVRLQAPGPDDPSMPGQLQTGTIQDWDTRAKRSLPQGALALLMVSSAGRVPQLPPQVLDSVWLCRRSAQTAQSWRCPCAWWRCRGTRCSSCARATGRRSW